MTALVSPSVSSREWETSDRGTLPLFASCVRRSFTVTSRTIRNGRFRRIRHEGHNHTLQWTGPASIVLVKSKSVGAVPAIERWSVMSQEERLHIIPVPSLVATLLRAEWDKDAPLTEAEAIEIRDKCPSVAVTDEMR